MRKYVIVVVKKVLNITGSTKVKFLGITNARMKFSLISNNFFINDPKLLLRELLV